MGLKQKGSLKIDSNKNYEVAGPDGKRTGQYVKGSTVIRVLSEPEVSHYKEEVYVDKHGLTLPKDFVDKSGIDTDGLVLHTRDRIGYSHTRGLLDDHDFVDRGKTVDDDLGLDLPDSLSGDEIAMSLS